MDYSQKIAISGSNGNYLEKELDKNEKDNILKNIVSFPTLSS